MPNWTNKLPEMQKHMGFDLRRTPALGSLHAICTSSDILVTDTHYFHGRTCPCERPNCPACNEAMPFRTHVYCSCFDVRAREHFLFECTAHAAKPLVEYIAANGSLRGCIIVATRPKGGRNSKVCIQTNICNLAKVQLPEPPDLIRALSTIWRLPVVALECEERKHAPSRVRINGDRLKIMREQEDNAGEPALVGEILAGSVK